MAFIAIVQAARDYFNAAGDGEFVNALGDGRDESAYRAGMKRTGQAMIARSATRHVPALRVARMFAHAGESTPRSSGSSAPMSIVNRR